MAGQRKGRGTTKTHVPRWSHRATWITLRRESQAGNPTAPQAMRLPQAPAQLAKGKSGPMKTTSTAKRLGLLLLLVLGIATQFGCGGGGDAGAVLFSPNFGTVVPLTAAEVETIITRAVASIGSPDIHVAVVDRRGVALGVFSSSGPLITDEANIALSLARTTAFFSNSQAPLSSRTVQFLSTFHFPPTFSGPFIPSACPVSGIAPCVNTAIAPQQTTTGVAGTPQGPLWQINATNRGAPVESALTTPMTAFNAGMEYPPSENIDASFPSPGITLLPGAVPLFKLNAEGTMQRLVGGVGVFIRPGGAPADPDVNAAEFAAFSGALGSGAPLDPNFFLNIPLAGAIYLNGLLLPYIEQNSLPPGFGAGIAPPAPPDPLWPITPVAGAQDPFGFLIGPLPSPEPGGLTLAEVNTIINQCTATADGNRSAIRLPLGSTAKIIAVVVDTRGLILAHFRMEDTLTDAVDVVPAKARTSVYYSQPGGPAIQDQWPGFPVGAAVTTTALGFLSQPFFPPGINSSGIPGPLFARAQFNQLPSQATRLLSAAPDPGYQNGAIFFPGAVPLYRGGVLVGALAISGDGVENNDFIAAGGALGFEPPSALRIDNFFFAGVRIPYLKFPTNP